MPGFHGEGGNMESVDQLETPLHVITAAYEVVTIRQDRARECPITVRGIAQKQELEAPIMKQVGIPKEMPNSYSPMTLT
jgi:hypothetical protein